MEQEQQEVVSEKPKRKVGFAAMTPEKQREICSKGGKAAHEKGKAHEFTAEEARAAGKKGGFIVSRDRAHMSAIGSRGGSSAGRIWQVPQLSKGDGE